MHIDNFYLIIGNLKILDNKCIINDFNILKKNKNDNYIQLNNNFLLRKLNNNFFFKNLLIIDDEIHYLEIIHLSIEKNNLDIIINRKFDDKIISNKKIKILLFYEVCYNYLFNDYIWSEDAYNAINQIKRKNKIIKLYYKIDFKKFNNIISIDKNSKIQLNEINELKILLNNNNIRTLINKKKNLEIPKNINDYNSLKELLENNKFIIYTKIN